ncbi:hypothetical protein J7T55_013041 [Diaporthe amygdali]|uniref:uncharacterized protein n=1 Tax=Phomopsis amygdali TaxID=1214568 RepID=UPI0022FEF001|nr:uncharacterized protein J7T55_013041 [Diaporthe amygdali]KAJ0118786.1 hypothetical protein J7T55_013041 [Diaporthe amygdali]
MATVLTRSHPVPQKRAIEGESGKDEPAISTTSLSEGLALGVPIKQKRFFWQTSRSYDPNAIATLPSVFDDPETAEKYLPRSDWENFHRFDPTARWTWGEENRLVRKIDLRIMLWAIVMFMALEIDRANLSQALTDNFLDDLKLSTDDYNLGNTVFKLAFLCSELPSQLVSKWMGPDRWIPSQLILWSFVAAAQFWLSGRESFLVCRALLGVLQGGFIPDGLFTLLVGLLAFGLMPAGPCQTASWFRGKKGWFDEREQTVIVNRVLREDPSKSNMHNREPVTPKLLWQSLKDFDLWPLYILGLAFQIPMTPQTLYLTLTLKGLGFDTFQTNLLTIPYYAGHNDKPLYKRGNRQLLAVCCMNIVLYFLTKAYYVFRNKQRDKKWNALTEDERLDYLANTTDQGNKRLDFRFQH